MIDDVRYILVLQWPASTEADFNAPIAMEDRLSDALGKGATVDGHDFGSGEMNIFIETEQPVEAFADAEAAFRGSPRWGHVRAAFREANPEEHLSVSERSIGAQEADNSWWNAGHSAVGTSAA